MDRLSGSYDRSPCNDSRMSSSHCVNCQLVASMCHCLQLYKNKTAQNLFNFSKIFTNHEKQYHIKQSLLYPRSNFHTKFSEAHTIGHNVVFVVR